MLITLNRNIVRAAIMLVVLAAGLATLAPTARATPTVGVGDNGPAMFQDPNFQALGTRISRKIIPYDFHKSEFELDHLRQWLAGAEALGIEPLIALQRSNERPNKLPSVGEFRYSISYLRRNFPRVRSISPWNEANHHSQPTARNPRRAAQYYGVVRELCRGCKIVAADVLDQKNMLPWLASFKRYAGGSARIWGLHSYVDTNNRITWKQSSTRRLLAAVKGQVWMTEVGGLVAFKNKYKYSERRAASAVSKTLKLARKSSRIRRVYLYSWYGSDHGKSRRNYRWDSGLVGPSGKPRAGFRVLRDWIDVYGA
ncbi:MAG: hypothetical protein WAO61_10265 [Solirubrobacterales bacterium]